MRRGFTNYVVMKCYLSTKYNNKKIKALILLWIKIIYWSRIGNLWTTILNLQPWNRLNPIQKMTSAILEIGKTPNIGYPKRWKVKKFPSPKHSKMRKTIINIRESVKIWITDRPYPSFQTLFWIWLTNPKTKSCQIRTSTCFQVTSTFT